MGEPKELVDDLRSPGDLVMVNAGPYFEVTFPGLDRPNEKALRLLASSFRLAKEQLLVSFYETEAASVVESIKQLRELGNVTVEIELLNTQGERKEKFSLSARYIAAAPLTPPSEILAMGDASFTTDTPARPYTIAAIFNVLDYCRVQALSLEHAEAAEKRWADVRHATANAVNTSGEAPNIPWETDIPYNSVT